MEAWGFISRLAMFGIEGKKKKGKKDAITVMRKILVHEMCRQPPSLPPTLTRIRSTCVAYNQYELLPLATPLALHLLLESASKEIAIKKRTSPCT